MPGNIFLEVELPQQKKYNDNGVSFPTVLIPNHKFPDHNLKQVIRNQKPWLEYVLHKNDAILFRGPSLVSSDSDFSDVVEAFGFEELPYVGGAAPRTNVVGRVFTSNESPPDQKIPFHHEMAQFVDRLEEYGLIYTRVLGEDDDPSSPVGRGWVSTFMTKDKSVAAERAEKLGMKLEWTNNGVKTIMGQFLQSSLTKLGNERSGLIVWWRLIQVGKMQEMIL